MVKKSTLNELVLLIAVCLAVLTQFPNINKVVLSGVNYVVWFLLLGYTLIRDKKIYPSRNLYFMVGLTAFCFTASLFLELLGVYWIRFSFIDIMIIPILVYYISYRVSLDAVENEGNSLHYVIKGFCVITLIMAVQISMQFATNLSTWLHSQTYLYVGGTHKNSTAQILGVCFIILLCYFKPDGLVKKECKLLCLVLIAVAMLYVQSRAALIAVAAGVVFNIFLQKDVHKSIKYTIGLLAIIVVAINIPKIKEILLQAFFIQKYSGDGNLDLNKFSSGRLGYWMQTWEQFCESPIVGVGQTYCDNFYINVLACGGIFLGLPFIIFFIVRLYMNVSYFKNYKSGYELLIEDRVVKVLLAVSFYYFVTSFFEGYPPYGPGVACMMLWLLCGYVDGKLGSHALIGRLNYEND